MKYAYLLKSLSPPEQRYVGSTTDLQARLHQHNQDKVSHTAKYLPWEIHVADGKCHICKKRWKLRGASCSRESSLKLVTLGRRGERQFRMV